MQEEAHEPDVYLGFAAPYEQDELYRLKACFLPLGKVGGKPAWLDPVSVPRSEQLTCKACSKPLCFLLQVYATSESDASHSFHRSLYLFVCRDPKCSKANDPSNLTVFRACLPRVNPFYSADGPMDPDLTSADEIPPSPADAPCLCRVCGCYAAKRCAKCGDAWYCSREHQAFDWKTGHKSSCGQPAIGEEPAPNPENGFLFEEMGMEMEREYLAKGVMDEEKESDDEEEEEEEESRQKRFNEYLNMVKSKKLEEAGAVVDAEADEAEDKKDCAFIRFNRVMQSNPEQILRYQRGGRPLIPSDKAPVILQVPSCASCGASRQFEMQLTPHLLSLIGVDSLGESIDWASVYVYTCSANCAPKEGSYVEEAVLKHDFE